MRGRRILDGSSGIINLLQEFLARHGDKRDAAYLIA